MTEAEFDVWTGRLLQECLRRGWAEISGEPPRLRLTPSGHKIAVAPDWRPAWRRHSWRRAVIAAIERLAEAAGVGPPPPFVRAPSPAGGTWRGSPSRRPSRRRRPPQVGGGQSTT